MTALVPVITNKGLKAVFNAENDGVSAKITHIALGSSGRSSPSKNELSLVTEKVRVPVADGQRINDHQIHVTAVVDTGPEFWVKEIGFILEDGTMLAVWADTDPLAYKSDGVPLMLAFDLVLEALPAQSVTVESTGASLSLAAWGEQYAATAAATVDNMARHVGLLFRVMDLEKQH